MDARLATEPGYFIGCRHESPQLFVDARLATEARGGVLVQYAEQAEGV